jgi:hypothetical protein
MLVPSVTLLSGASNDARLPLDPAHGTIAALREAAPLRGP